MVFSGLFAFLAQAEWQDVDGTSSPSTWPTAGDVRIIQKTGGNRVVITDAEKSIVEGWSNVQLAAGSSYLIFNNRTTAITLKANVSGSGNLWALESAGLTLSGDNRSRTGTSDYSSWFFSNSVVTVAHEYGLGDKTSKPATFYFPASGQTSLSIRYGGATQTSFTNHCPIVYQMDSSCTTAIFGSEAQSEWWVQDADFINYYPGGPNRTIRFRNNSEFTSGVFGGRRAMLGQHYWSYATAEGVQVKFSGDVQLNCDMLTRPLGWVVLGPKATYTFATGGGVHFSTISSNLGKLVIGIDDPFRAVAGASADYVCGWGLYPQDQVENDNGLHLNGHPVTVTSMSIASTGPTESDYATYTRYNYVTSSIPTYFQLKSDQGGRDLASKCPVEICGAVDFIVDNNATNHIACRVSQPNGTLRVKSGCLHYMWNAGWNGTNTVVEGGLIDCDSVNAFKGRSALTMTGGKLRLHKATPVFFESATIGGTTLAEGVYSVEKLGAKGLGAFFEADDDSAALTVVGQTTEWTGWKQPSGSTVRVPMGMTVYIYDDDVPYVEHLGNIEIGVNSKVVCANQTVRLTLTAAVRGPGEFHIVNESTPITCGVTLLADNTGLVAPGFFDIRNANVAVSNEFGLGGVETAPAQVRYDTNASGSLVFGLLDRKTFTNSVPIRLTTPDSGSAVCWRMGSRSTNETFVQTGDLSVSEVGWGGKVLGYMGNVVLDCKVIAEKGNSLVVNANANAHVTFGPHCRFSQTGGQKLSVYHMGASHPNDVGTPWFQWDMSARPEVVGSIALNVACVRMTRDNQFGLPTDAALPGFYYYTDVGPEELYLSRLDLNGHDTAFGQLSAQHDGDITPGAGGPTDYHLDVVSEAPALFTCAAKDQNRHEVLRFGGAAGWAHTGSGTNLLVNFKNETTGSFVVTGGCSGLDWGATWGGTNVVVNGGVLYVGAQSVVAGAFVNADQAGLHLDNGGKLYVEDGQLVFGRAWKDHKQVTAGVYSSSASPVAGTKPVDWIEGKGSLKVTRSHLGLSVFIAR